MYCELTGLYWAWKNLDADYIGLAHYRRHFKGKNKSANIMDNVLSYKEASDLLDKHDILVTKKRNYIIETLYSHYAHTHHVETLDCTRDVIKDIYPDYLDSFDKTMKKTHMHAFQARYPGRLSEMLLDVWINKNELGYKEVPFMYTEKIDRVKKVKSFLKAKFLKQKYNGSF